MPITPKRLAVRVKKMVDIMYAKPCTVTKRHP
jgi:hypothetical protein